MKNNFDLFDKYSKQEIINYVKNQVKEKTIFSNKEVKYIKNHKLLKIMFKNMEIEKEYYTYKDPFICMLSRVIHQQINFNLANKTEAKFYSYLKFEITPEIILDLKENEFTKCGINKRKLQYMKNIALFIKDNNDLWNEILISKNFDFISNSLTKIKGVGNWSVWTFLLFHLKWKNMIKENDLVLLRGLKKIKNWTKKEMKEFIELNKPYGSIISINLWKYAMHI